MNTFLELTLRRRSIRRYQDRPVEDDKLQTLLQAALSSPSSKHLNPWEFVVVTDRDVLTRMAGCRTYGSAMLRESPLGIVVCADADLADTWQCDAAIAAHNILLAAEDLGLGACWVQVHGRGLDPQPDADNALADATDMIRTLLHIPDRLKVLCIVSVGYKAEEKKPINPDKLQYDKIHYEQY